MHRSRFVASYVVLGLCLATIGAATWKAASIHRQGPLAPGAVALVERFLGAVQQGDLKTACRMFSALPACDPTVAAPPVRSYKVFPAEPTVDGVDVPATLNQEYMLFMITERLGRYRIDDIVADPAPLAPAELTPPLEARRARESGRLGHPLSP